MQRRAPRSVTLGAAAACLLALLLGSPHAARAAEVAPLPDPLRPADVLAHARAHRAEILVARARARAAAQAPKVAGALPDPMVMVSADHVPLRLHGVDASLLVQQDFPLSGVLGARTRSAEAEGRVASAEVQVAALDVEYEALSAYLMLAERRRMLEVLDEQAAVARQIYDVARARLSASSGAAGDAVRARLDVARLEGERRASEAEARAAAAMLDAALGRPPTNAMPTCEFDVADVEPPPVGALVERALSSRPDLSAMRERVARARAGVDVMRSMYRPMAFVRAGPSYTMADGPGAMLMIGVSVPIWREKLSAGVAEANAMASMASAEVQAMRRMIEGEVGSARENVVAARARLATANIELVPLSRQAIGLTLAAYAAGQAPLVTVLDAARALRDARMEQVVAGVRVAAAWARLGRAVGSVKVGAP